MSYNYSHICIIYVFFLMKFHLCIYWDFLFFSLSELEKLSKWKLYSLLFFLFFWAVSWHGGENITDNLTKFLAPPRLCYFTSSITLVVLFFIFSKFVKIFKCMYELIWMLLLWCFFLCIAIGDVFFSSFWGKREREVFQEDRKERRKKETPAQQALFISNKYIYIFTKALELYIHIPCKIDLSAARLKSKYH